MKIDSNKTLNISTVSELKVAISILGKEIKSIQQMPSQIMPETLDHIKSRVAFLSMEIKGKAVAGDGMKELNKLATKIKEYSKTYLELSSTDKNIIEKSRREALSGVARSGDKVTKEEELSFSGVKRNISLLYTDIVQLIETPITSNASAKDKWMLASIENFSNRYLSLSLDASFLIDEHFGSEKSKSLKKEMITLTESLNVLQEKTNFRVAIGLLPPVQTEAFDTKDRALVRIDSGYEINSDEDN